MHPTPSREHTPLRDLALYSVLALLCVLAWDYSGLDYPVMQALGNAQGFALKPTGGSKKCCTPKPANCLASCWQC